MNEEKLFSWRNSWLRASVGGVVGLALVAIAIGFIWLPLAQKDGALKSLWATICGAAGVPQTWLSSATIEPPVRSSDVVLVPNYLEHADAISIGRGATLALRCTMCHGVQGISEADSPNLAGQYPLVIYKQLRDYQSGHRSSAVMKPIVQGLSDENLRDLAAYYAYLPKPPQRFPAPAEVPQAPLIVSAGAPMRNIAPCASCHGGMGRSTAAPWIQGMPEVYLKNQLLAFASGARRNDVNEQMRNIARRMTPQEIDEAARYYSQLP